MALPVVAAVAGGAALAAYADAKLLLRSDLKTGTAAKNVQAAQQFIADRVAADKLLVYHIFEERSTTKEGDVVFLEFEDRKWTYKEWYYALQPVGNWLINDLGIRKGEIVALDGGNSPEYLMLWFALEAIGCAPAAINCNLTQNPLVYSAKLSDTRFLITDTGVRHLVEPCETELSAANIKTVYYDQQFISSLSDTSIIPKTRNSRLDPTALACLIYTSGTTGMPKGTILTRARELLLTRSSEYLGLKPGIKMYTCLPLYHGAAHGLCVVPSIGGCSTVYLSRKFSHKTLWPEVRKSEAQILQYVGELCRYLINAPPSPLDKMHKITMAWGNGMRPDVWEPFRQRFGIEMINELYAATDGLGACFNGNRGDFSRNAITVRGAYWKWANGGNEKHVRIDPDSQEILRGKDGFAIECKTGEAGEVLHRLDPRDPDRAFAGAKGPARYYNNRAAGEKRKMPNIFEKGDLWFRSGDMHRHDANGCVYFIDRLGDTFRWHSENVSTNEVSDVIGTHPHIAEANVYGVLVPHSDGRAGCAAVVPSLAAASSTTVGTDAKAGGVDMRSLAQHALASLPRYAVPIFIRVVKELEYTGTMKLQKGRLRGEGIELDKIEEEAKKKGESVDAMFWLPPGGQEYVPFGEKDLEEVKGGRVRL